MSSLFNSDGSFPLQFAIIFLVIFVILAAGAYAFRRVMGGRMSLSSKAAQRGRQPRLGIIDIYELDRQRQLILLRRDNVEHLLLVGGPNDVVVERNIVRGAARVALDEAARDPLPEAAEESPAPVIAPTRPLVEPAAATGPAPPQIASPQVASPQVASLSAPAPIATRPLERRTDENALFEAIAHAKPAAEPTMEPIVEPPSPRGPRRAPPPLANLKPEAAPERLRPAPPAPLVAEPGKADALKASTFLANTSLGGASLGDLRNAAPPEAEPAPAEPPAFLAAPAPVSNPAPRAIDAVILADMARQLEETLKRPTAEAPPPPAPEQTAPAASAPPPEPAVETAPSAQAVDPMAAAMAASSPEQAADDLFEDRAAAPEPAPPAFMPAPPPPAPAPEAPAEPEPEPARPEPGKPATQNPFSVEEIEAEFARLLGRPLDRKG